MKQYEEQPELCEELSVGNLSKGNNEPKALEIWSTPIWEFLHKNKHTEKFIVVFYCPYFGLFWWESSDKAIS